MRVKICILIFCFINLFGVSFAIDKELKDIDARIEKQTVFRVGSWCVAPWNESYCSAEVLQINGDEVTVRIFDHAFPVRDWPVVTLHTDDLQKMMIQKHESLESLIEGLKANQTLRSPEIERAFRIVDRAYFAPRHPYFDTAIDIGQEMCISSPHIHASCLELLRDLFESATSVLDVGTGTGFMATMFASLAPQAEVTGIEYYEELTVLAEKNCQILKKEITDRLHWVTGNGEAGYFEGAPYDVIHVGFMCKNIPQALLHQLKPGGKMIIPVGSNVSSYDSRLCGGEMLLIDKDQGGSIHIYRVFECSFVPSQVTQ